MNKKIIFIALIIVLAVAGSYIWFVFNSNQRTGDNNPTPSAQPETIEYINNQYGFSFSLPQDWKNFSTVTTTWEGEAIGPQGNYPVEHGPIISLRNPNWTAQNPYQDIPIMVFTLTQWDAMQRDEFHIGAAPVNPSELGRNEQYVFALPARYNYAFPTGWEEVQSILDGHPLHATLQNAQINWESLILKIRTVLTPTFLGVKVEEFRPLNIYKESDITGDGVFEALVDLGTGGAYTDNLTLFRMENGNPVVAQFKGQDGKISPLIFINGASVRNGASTDFLPSDNAIYSVIWTTDDSGKINNCETMAYQWNYQEKTFNYSSAISDKVKADFCK